MSGLPLAHVGGIPIEETLASLGPVLLVAFGVAAANLRASLRRVRSRATAHAPSRKNGATQCGRAGLNSNRDDELVATRSTRRQRARRPDRETVGHVVRE
jgi:hypothetical protein